MHRIHHIVFALTAVLASGCSGDEPSNVQGASGSGGGATDAASSGQGAGGGASSSSGSGGSPIGPTNAFLDGFFPIAADVQPTDTFDTWKQRGVNTLVRVPDGSDPVAWSSEAEARGLKMIRQPLPNPQDDVGKTSLLAWAQGDEPDSDGDAHVAELKAQYASWKALDPSRPVFLNFGGGGVQDTSDACNGPGDGGNEACYPGYIEAADWISDDIYPVTGWNQPTQLAWVGQVLDKLAAWSGPKPLFAYIESSDQNLSWTPPETRGVTPDELRGEVWDAVIHGARGILYFCVAFNPFQFDATPPDVAAEMTKQNALLTELGPVLQGPIDPAGASAEVTAPIEAAWRLGADGKKYFIVLNLSPDAQQASVKLTGVTSSSADVHGEARTVAVAGGSLADDFAPYAVHVYVMQ